MGNMGLVVLEEFIHDRQNSRLLYRYRRWIEHGLSDALLLFSASQI